MKGRNSRPKTRLRRGNFIGRCFKRGKLQYETEEEARLDAKRLRKFKGPKVRPYLCPYCNFWHTGHWRPPGRRQPREAVDKGLNTSSS